jgi:hypothetical protein
MAVIALIWFFGTLLGSTFSYNNTEATWAGSRTDQSFNKGGVGQITDLQYLLDMKNAVQTVNVLGVIPLPVPNGDYFSVAWHIMLLRFSFIVGNSYGDMFWYIFLMPFALMGIAGFILTMMSIIRGNLTWT